MATYKFDRDRKRLYEYFRRRDLQMCRIMRLPQWAVLGIRHTPMIHYRNGEWHTDCPELRQMLKQALRGDR